MRFSVLSRKPRQRRQEIAFILVVLGSFICLATIYSFRSRDAKRAAIALCEQAKVGAGFDRASFSNRGRTQGFDSYLRGPSNEGVLILSKRFFARSEVSCLIYFRSTMITKTEVASELD